MKPVEHAGSRDVHFHKNYIFPKRYDMNHKHIFRLLIFSVLLLLWGCMENSLNLQIRYPEILGLQQDDPVYFEQNVIGKVTKVLYTTQGDYLVYVSIAPAFSNAATVDSKFFIGNDLMDKQGKAVTIVQENPGGKVLKRGATVQGSVRAASLSDILNDFIKNATGTEYDLQEALEKLKKSLNATSQKMGKELADRLDDLSRQLQKFSDEMKKVPEREEVKQLEESIKQFAEEFNKAQKSVKEHIRNEVIPQLREELDHLREQLHQEGRDKELEEIDGRIKEMSVAVNN